MYLLAGDTFCLFSWSKSIHLRRLNITARFFRLTSFHEQLSASLPCFLSTAMLDITIIGIQRV